MDNSKSKQGLDTVADINGKLTKANNSLKEYWSGEAANTFSKRQEEIQKNIEKIQSQLNLFSVVESKASELKDIKEKIKKKELEKQKLTEELNKLLSQQSALEEPDAALASQIKSLEEEIKLIEEEIRKLKEQKKAIIKEIKVYLDEIINLTLTLEETQILSSQNITTSGLALNNSRQKNDNLFYSNQSDNENKKTANTVDKLEEMKKQKELKAYINNKIENYKDEFYYYNQNDYGKYEYGYKDPGVKATIATSGCGPTSMAMVLGYFLQDDSITPVETAKYALGENDSSTKYRVNYVGTDGSSYFPAIASDYGVECENLSLTSDNIKTSLKEGKMLILNVGAGTISTGGHFVVLKGITEEGKIIMADPNRKRNNEILWDTSTLISEGKNLWAFDD